MSVFTLSLSLPVPQQTIQSGDRAQSLLFSTFKFSRLMAIHRAHLDGTKCGASMIIRNSFPWLESKEDLFYNYYKWIAQSDGRGWLNWNTPRGREDDSINTIPKLISNHEENEVFFDEMINMTTILFIHACRFIRRQGIVPEGRVKEKEED